MTEKSECPTCSPFASRSLGRHLVRGLAALGAVAGAVFLLDMGGAWAGAGACAALALALVLLRGCPMCWTLGLIETLAARRATCAPPVRNPGRPSSSSTGRR